jgi:MFS family permease
MVGMGETYIPAFALAVGFEDRTAGLLASIPMLAGGVMQMVSPRAVRMLGSHRRWVILCVIVQSLTFIPFVAASLAGTIPTWLAFLVSSIYWGSGMGAGPAWNTWIGTLVPRTLRARYFARRTRISQFAVFAGFTAAGFSLQFGKQAGVTLQTFAALFAISGFCRMLSAWFLTMHTEHVPVPSDTTRIPMLTQLRSLYKGREGRLLRYIIAVQAAVQISGPYFSPFMLKQMKMSYGIFALLIALSFLA